MGTLKSKVAQRKHDRGVKHAENYSELLDNEATVAIEYAVASIEQAKVAVLDAIVGRVEVEAASAPNAIDARRATSSTLGKPRRAKAEACREWAAMSLYSEFTDALTEVLGVNAVALALLWPTRKGSRRPRGAH